MKPLLLLAVVACGPVARPIDVVTPVDFGPGENAGLRESDFRRAINDLNTAAGCPIVRLLPAGTSVTDAWTVSFEFWVGGVAGEVNRDARTINIRSVNDPGETWLVTMHELGHAFGLEHVPYGIMCAHLGGCISGPRDPEQDWQQFLSDLGAKSACSSAGKKQ